MSDKKFQQKNDYYLDLSGALNKIALASKKEISRKSVKLSAVSSRPCACCGGIFNFSTTKRKEVKS